MDVTNLTIIVFLHQNITLKMAGLLFETCPSIYRVAHEMSYHWLCT